MKNAWKQLFLFANLVLTSVFTMAEDGVTNDLVIFGRSTNKTGSSTSSFTERTWGYDAYFSKINKAGGVHGRKIQVVELDDAYEPGNAFRNTKKFVEEMKVFGLYGYAGTPTMQAVIPYLKNTNVPFIALNAASILRDPVIKNVFTVRAGYQDELRALVDHAVVKSKLKKIALFYQDDAYGKEGETGLNRELPKHGLKIFASGSYKRNEKDIKPAFDKIMAAKPDAVICFAQAKQTGEFLLMAEKAKWKVPVYITSNQATNDMIKTAGTALDQAIIANSLPEVDDMTYQVVKDFNADMKTIGQAPGGVAFEGYIGAMAIVEALKRTGKNLTRERFIDAMESLNGFDFGGLKSNISAKDHQAMNFVYLFRFKDGKPERL